MTTLANIDTASTSGRSVNRMTLGVLAILAIVGVASTFAVSTMGGAQSAPTTAGAPDRTLATGSIAAAHSEPFLGTPRWTGSWSRSH
jgi:hypothetical protein